MQESLEKILSQEHISTWMTLVLGFFIGMALRFVLRFLLSHLQDQSKFLQRLPPSFSALLKGAALSDLDPIIKPLSSFAMYLIWLITIEISEAPPRMVVPLSIFLKVLIAFALVKLCYRTIDRLGIFLSTYLPRKDHSIDDQLIVLLTRSSKVFTIIFGILILLQSLGLNVMSLLAGLGLGGLALALAAQDTAANLFGSVTIIADKPFKVDDWIKIGQIEGTIEEIGFRSTRVRTFYQSQITIPNSMIAKEPVENMRARPMRETKFSINLVYTTPCDKIEQFCAEIRNLINSHPLTVKNQTLVYFAGFGDFALNVQIRYFLVIGPDDNEIAIRERLLFGVLRLSEPFQIEFAYPTQTHFVRT